MFQSISVNSNYASTIEVIFIVFDWNSSNLELRRNNKQIKAGSASRRAAETDRQQNRVCTLGLCERSGRQLRAIAIRVSKRKLCKMLHVQLGAQDDEHGNTAWRDELSTAFEGCVRNNARQMRLLSKRRWSAGATERRASQRAHTQCGREHGLGGLANHLRCLSRHRTKQQQQYSRRLGHGLWRRDRARLG